MLECKYNYLIPLRFWFGFGITFILFLQCEYLENAIPRRVFGVR
jgi:hypothetical protein